MLSKERKAHSSQDDKVTIENGARNETLFQEAVTLVHSGVSEQDIRDHIEARAKACVERLDSSELENILTSALRYRKSTSIPFTGASERFVSDHADVIYCSDQKAWYVWNGKHWSMDDQNVRQRAKQTTRNIPKEAMNIMR